MVAKLADFQAFLNLGRWVSSDGGEVGAGMLTGQGAYSTNEKPHRLDDLPLHWRQIRSGRTP